MYKKLASIILGLLLVAVAFWSIVMSNPDVKSYIKAVLNIKNIQENIKEVEYSAGIIKYKFLKSEIAKGLIHLPMGESPLEIEFVPLPDLTLNRSTGHIDFYGQDLIFVSGTGDFFVLDRRGKKWMKRGASLANLFNNGLRKQANNPYLKGFIRDILIIGEDIIISGVDHLQLGRETYVRLKVVRCQLSLVVGVDNCKQIFQAENVQFPYFLTHEGGRIAAYEDTVLVTVGDFGKGHEAQNISSSLGKVIKVGEHGSWSVFTLGHRNPQGLFFNPKTGFFIETEHGPSGGDEINVLMEGANFGWPLESAGVTDSYDLQPNGSVSGLRMPFWTTKLNPAISQGVYIPQDKCLALSDTLVIGSLTGSKSGPEAFSGHNLLLVSADLSRAELEKVFVGDRVRDIGFWKSESKLAMVLENQRSLGLINLDVNTELCRR